MRRLVIAAALAAAAAAVSTTPAHAVGACTPVVGPGVNVCVTDVNHSPICVIVNPNAIATICGPI